MRELLVLVVSAGIVLLGMPWLIRYMRKRQFGQTIYELGPQAHLQKQGTPNMGGVLIATACVLTALAFGAYGGYAWQMLPAILAALGAMAVGFADDYTKIALKQHEGLTPRQKILGQVVVGLLFSLYCYFRSGSSILVPFTKLTWDLGAFYVPLMTLLFIFMTNSANLQDGADGLMATVTIIGGVGLAAVALLLNRGVTPVDGVAMETIAVALVGAAAGFIKFNKYPAKIMMGDTGSMFIGGVFTAIAMLLGIQLWLILLCFTMIMSSLSVIMQRLYFKATKGKRIFKMSPIHHHFELSGMNENSIAIMYGLVLLLLSVIAVVGTLPLIR